MHKLCFIIAFYLCVQPFAQADSITNNFTSSVFYLNITASNDVNVNDIANDIRFGNKCYIDEAFDIMINLVLKKAKSNSRLQNDTDIIRRIGDSNTSFGLGVSRHRVRLKIKYRF